ncbi:YjgN family protein [Thalassolituus oleivorans]|uniref:Multipass membrane protein n=1 Tax=Thalassolituus oleivorans MIL-1 TaxID=1298593 RepID=M5DT02_9GAMM|nr:YjgN family protein [Thalassolituus oleivorans]CCU72531.1 multipass membrane protein [Thalassolituus oleivorans MIL-1]|tara:strand:+ start:160 stop:1239 length:1080 start_codon:yes stop_codon:yes gene_type:complete
MTNPINGASIASAPSLPVQFSATKFGYFKLWHVNLLLSIVTLGIYSAWAKVRNTQYLYGHTQVDGHRLAYLATPLQILRGRFIAVIAFVALSTIANFFPIAGLILYGVLLLALPWLIIQGIRFTLHMTAYRNIRFSFTGTYTDALINFIVLPILSIFTLYLAMPWVMRRIQLFMMNNITFGGEKFSLNTSTGQYYLAALAAFLLSIAVIAIGATLIFSGVDFTAFKSEDPKASKQLILSIFLPLYGLMFLTGYLSMALFNAMIRNHVVNNLQVENVARFSSSVKVIPYMWLTVSNAIILIFTIGLGHPIALIRKLDYLSKCTQVQVLPKMNELINTVGITDSAFGEEAAGLFDADVSLI